MILNPCTCGGDPYYVASLKLWRCGFCNKAGYVGDPEGKGWNEMNSSTPAGTLSKFDLPNRQESVEISTQ